MNELFKIKLRQEHSLKISGNNLNEKHIPLLKEKHYYIIPSYSLTGDAPKALIGAYLYSEKNNFYKKNYKSWTKYIAKTAEKWYPNESVTEFVINKLGEELGVNMNNSCIVKCNNQIRFLSEFFLNPETELLYHGAEICGDYLNDRDFASEIANNKKDARELFTFEFICDALNNRFKSHSLYLKEELVKMLAFDCVIGNNDRHFYNWGVITNLKKTIKNPIFAPVYDSSRGLFWNLSDENIVNIYRHDKNNTGKHLQKYAKEAAPRMSCEENKKANHFQLIGHIKTVNANYRRIINEISSMEMQDKVIKAFKEKYSSFFIPERQYLIEKLICHRFEQTRKA